MFYSDIILIEPIALVISTGSKAGSCWWNVNPCPWAHPKDDTLLHNFDKNKELQGKMVDVYRKNKRPCLHHNKLVFVSDLKIHYLYQVNYDKSAGLFSL